MWPFRKKPRDEYQSEAFDELCGKVLSLLVECRDHLIGIRVAVEKLAAK